MKHFANILSLICFLGSIYFCLGQSNPNNLYTKKGKLIVEQNSSNSMDKWDIIGYRLERVELVKSIDMRQGQPPLENVFRIVIVAAAPLPRENYSVWVDQTQMDAYQIKPNEIAALIYAGKLPNGTIKVGLSKRSESDPTARLVLPGTLSVPPEYATPSAEIEAIRPIIKLRRVPPANRAIELSVVIPQTPCEMSNTGFHLTVEGHTSICAGRQEFVIWFTPEQFSQLRDGADIILRGTGGSGVRNVSILGQLDKRLLQ